MEFSTNNATNMSSNLYCSGYNNQQIAYPVGLDKDSYSITTNFTQNLETGEISLTCKAIKNWVSQSNVVLHEGTYLECVEVIRTLVTEIEKEYGVWNRDKRGEYVLSNPNSIVLGT